MSEGTAPSTGSFAGRLMRQGGLYALGNMALKAGGLLLALLYLNPDYLSVGAFGYFSLLFVTAQLGIFIVGLGLGTGLLKFMADPAYAAERSALPFTALVATLGAALAGGVLFYVLAGPLAALMLDAPDRTGLILLLGGYVVFKVIGAVPMMVLRVQERVGWYVTAAVAELVVLIGAAYVLMVGEGLGLWGLMGAYTVSAGLSAVVLTGLMLRFVPWQFDRRLVRRLIAFGMPLVLASFASWFLNAGDRYLLKWLADAEAVGLYEWAVRLAGVLNMLFVQSFSQAFQVIGLKTLGAGNDGAQHRKTLHHYVIWTGWAALGLSLLAYDLTRLLPADAAYLQADDLVLLLALGFLNYGVYFIIINIVYATGRTKAISINVLVAALLNALLNLALIPVLGVLGAAGATFLAYLALAWGAAYFARKDIQVAFPWKTYLMVLGLVVGLYLFGRTALAWEMLPRLALRGALIGGYFGLVMLAGLYSRDEVKQAAAWVRRRLRKPTASG